MSVILAMSNEPAWLAAKSAIREGTRTIVRLVNCEEPEAHIIAFRSNIQKITSLCGHWLILDYPKQLQKVPLRNYSRIPITVACSILDENAKSTLSHGYLQDISINGSAFIGELIKDCIVEARYQLQVKFSDKKEPMLIPITVKNIKNLQQNSEQSQYGVLFDESNPENKAFLQQVILHYLSN